MKKKLLLGLFLLIIFVLLFKFPLGDEFEDFCCRIHFFCESILDISKVLRFFLFPFLLSLLFLYLFRKHKNDYHVLIQCILWVLIGTATFFAIQGAFWVFPSLSKIDGLPILGGLLGVLILGEEWFSISLILLFFAFLFLAFGKLESKRSRLESPLIGIFLFSVIVALVVWFFNSGYKVPKEVQCEEIRPSKEIKEEDLVFNDFEISGCCGRYSYHTRFQPKENGRLYIKAFEVESNDRLSEEYITEWSKAEVKDTATTLYSGSFNIYEGVGRQYCARIELWYKPDNGKESKIAQKNYIVEGKD